MTDAGNTDPIEPVAERFTGTVLPGGRGMELHGVPLEGSPDLVDAWDEGDPVVPAEEPDEQSPVPVRIVKTGGREQSRFRVMRAYAGQTTPTLIVGANDSRQSVRIRVLAQDYGIWIGAAPHIANRTFGYPVPASGEITLSTEMDVWAVADSGAGADVPCAVLQEYTVEIK